MCRKAHQGWTKTAFFFMAATCTPVGGGALVPCSRNPAKLQSGRLAQVQLLAMTHAVPIQLSRLQPASQAQLRSTVHYTSCKQRRCADMQCSATKNPPLPTPWGPRTVQVGRAATSAAWAQMSVVSPGAQSDAALVLAAEDALEPAVEAALEELPLEPAEEEVVVVVP